MELTEKLITWFKSLSETEKQRRFPDLDRLAALEDIDEKMSELKDFTDCTPSEKMLRKLPEYAKRDILLYNGVK